MPITGMESTLKAQLIAAIEAGIAAEGGSAPASPNSIAGLAKGIADAIIPFLVANVEVTTGIPVATTGTAAAQAGATTAPGTIT